MLTVDYFRFVCVYQRLNYSILLSAQYVRRVSETIIAHHGELPRKNQTLQLCKLYTLFVYKIFAFPLTLFTLHHVFTVHFLNLLKDVALPLLSLHPRKTFVTLLHSLHSVLEDYKARKFSPNTSPV